MKKYRLKEEVKKFIGVPYPEAINTLEYWDKCYVKLEALEEVPSRIELESINISVKGELQDAFYRLDGLTLGKESLDLCEKALNGELLDIDRLDDDDFWNWYEDSKYLMHTNSHTFNELSLWLKDNSLTYGIKEVLKQYLNEKK